MIGLSTCRALRWTWLVIVLAACGPKQETLEIPTPPDMGELIADYNAPSASIDDSSIEAIIKSYEELQQYRVLVCGDEACDSGLFCALCPGMTDLDRLLDETLKAMGGGNTSSQEGGLTLEGFGSKSGALEDSPFTIDGDGYIRASRPCAGDPDGIIHLTVVFSDEGMNAVIWGQVTGCDLTISGVLSRVYVDFELSLGVEQVQTWIPLEKLGLLGDLLKTLVLRVEGRIITGGETLSLSVDTRALLEAEEVQLRVPVQAEHLLFYFKNQFDYGFDALNGRWRCDFPFDLSQLTQPGKKIECTQTDTGESVTWSF